VGDPESQRRISSKVHDGTAAREAFARLIWCLSRRRTWRCQRRQKSHGPWFVFRIVFN
jgi:hypothetical protein